MGWHAVIAVLMSAGVLVTGSVLLFMVYRLQLRRYHRVIATDLLNDWHLQLELLDAQTREQARLSPPPNVLAAMALLPSRGLRGDWVRTAARRGRA
jgi:hypothetical protein